MFIVPRNLKGSQGKKNNCLAILCDLFGMVISDLLEKLSDLQLRDQKVTA